MDLAYANEQIYAPASRASTPKPTATAGSDDATTTSSRTQENDPSATPRASATSPQQRADLSTEFSETFKAFSASPWGARLGGFWGNVQKQSQSYYSEAVKEVEDLRVDAMKGLSGLQESLVNRTRSLSLEGETGPDAPATHEKPGSGGNIGAPSATDQELEDNETFIARFKTEAAKRLKDVQKAEDAADEALLRFGTNLRNFLRDAVAVTAPEPAEGASTEVLFESKDATTGKRVIHTSRLDAQLHVIHTSPNELESDPSGSGEQWATFKKAFDVESKTDAIARDLELYPDLRRTMEGLVPEKVEYKDFWTRYYFLRHVLEAQEERRKELLKGMSPVFPQHPSQRATSQTNHSSSNPQHLQNQARRKKSAGTQTTTTTRSPMVPPAPPNPQRSTSPTQTQTTQQQPFPKHNRKPPPNQASPKAPQLTQMPQQRRFKHQAAARTTRNPSLTLRQATTWSVARRAAQRALPRRSGSTRRTATRTGSE
jgi:hypothetical protein